MKRLFAAVLSLMMVLCACADQSESWTVSRNGIEFLVDSQTISDGSHIYQYEFSGHAESYQITIAYPNGSAYWFSKSGQNGHGGWSEDYRETAYVDGNTLCQVILARAPEPEAAGPILGAAALIVLGLFHGLCPERAWYWGYGWRYKNAEPSDDALMLSRLGGIVAVVLGVILLVH